MNVELTTPKIESRSQFGILCNTYKVRIAIEIGTDQGVFAAQFMKHFDGLELICIDNYRPYEWMCGSRQSDIMTAVLALFKWHGRTKLVLEDSEVVAKNLPDYIRERVDFVYIDADHKYESVKRDINTWWNILNPGGILAGHDYEIESHPGVVQAVDELVTENKLELFLTDEKTTFPSSWYVFKSRH